MYEHLHTGRRYIHTHKSNKILKRKKLPQSKSGLVSQAYNSRTPEEAEKLRAEGKHGLHSEKEAKKNSYRVLPALAASACWQQLNGVWSGHE